MRKIIGGMVTVLLIATTLALFTALPAATQRPSGSENKATATVDPCATTMGVPSPWPTIEIIMGTSASPVQPVTPITYQGMLTPPTYSPKFLATQEAIVELSRQTTHSLYLTMAAQYQYSPCATATLVATGTVMPTPRSTPPPGPTVTGTPVFTLSPTPPPSPYPGPEEK
jgi:hypothetical protein